MANVAKSTAKRKRPYRGLYVKLYVSSLDDIKIRQMDAATRCFWIDALLLAKPGHGILPDLREIAFRLRMAEAEARSRIMSLVALGLVDEDHVGSGVVWAIHAWDAWQFDSTSTPRVRRYRERINSTKTDTKRQRNVSCNASRNENETLETNSSSSSHTNSRSRVSGNGPTNSCQDEEFDGGCVTDGNASRKRWLS